MSTCSEVGSLISELVRDVTLQEMCFYGNIPLLPQTLVPAGDKYDTAHSQILQDPTKHDQNLCFFAEIHGFCMDAYLLNPDSKVKLSVISHQFNPKSVDFDQILHFFAKIRSFQPKFMVS